MCAATLLIRTSGHNKNGRGRNVPRSEVLLGEFMIFTEYDLKPITIKSRRNIPTFTVGGKLLTVKQIGALVGMSADGVRLRLKKQTADELVKQGRQRRKLK